MASQFTKKVRCVNTYSFTFNWFQCGMNCKSNLKPWLVHTHSDAFLQQQSRKYNPEQQQQYQLQLQQQQVENWSLTQARCIFCSHLQACKTGFVLRRKNTTMTGCKLQNVIKLFFLSIFLFCHHHSFEEWLNRFPSLCACDKDRKNMLTYNEFAYKKTNDDYKLVDRF